MSKHRIRQRRPQQPPDDPAQAEVVDNAAELLVLWRALPSALARDAAAAGSGDGTGRHASGAAKGSPAAVNLSVLEASALIEAGVADVAEQAARILNVDRQRTVDDVLASLPDWHRSLAGRDMPLAKHLRGDLASWLREARAAIGVRRHDTKLGPLCPDHRDSAPTPLLRVGDVARLADSLLAGPPSDWLLPVGPLCHPLITLVPVEVGVDYSGRPVHRPCRHESCEQIRERRVADRHGRRTDWTADPDGALSWASIEGAPAFTWTSSTAIRCPKCGSSWASVTERRVLARRLAELGDLRPDNASLVS